MTPSLDDLKAAVETARDGVRAARMARETATFDLDAAELDLLQAQGKLRDADPIYGAVQEAAQVSDLDGNHPDREALCDAVDAFIRSLRASGYDIVRRSPQATRPCVPFEVVRPGDRLVPDEHFTCLDADVPVEVREDPRGELYVHCRDGRHMLDGQLEHPDGGLVGFSLKAF